MWSRQRKRNWAILAPMQSEHIATHTAALLDFSGHFFCKIKVPSSLNIFVRHIEYSTFKTLSAGRPTRQH